jgi:hypothetical protein
MPTRTSENATRTIKVMPSICLLREIYATVHATPVLTISAAIPSKKTTMSAICW